MHLSHHAGRTHVGRVRKKNEDVFEIRPSVGVALVADGMGGAACGEVASGMAAKAVGDYVETTQGLTPEEILVDAINAANTCVWEASQGPGACDGMGTTLVIAYWRNDLIWLANVGDSRGYLLRDGVLQQLSYDQNLANDLRESLKLTDEQIASYPQRHALTMAVGTRADVRCRMYSGPLQDGDLIVLCSDGLSNPVKADQILSILMSTPSLDDAADALIQAALDRGGPDNITVVLLRFAA